MNTMPVTQPSRQFMLVANDEKVTWDAAGNIIFMPPGKDHVMIFDIGSDPANPRHVTTIPVENSLFGPPTNLAITPDNSLALLANPMSWQQCGGTWTPMPGNLLHVIDLTIDTPCIIDVIEVGKQPSGMAISRDGRHVLIANRADSTISFLRIQGKEVVLLEHLPVDGHPIAVAFAADGKKAFFVKMNHNKLGVIHITEQGITHDAAEDIATGLVPYNVAITPDGAMALTVDMGHPQASDGHADTVSVTRLDMVPPRTVDRIMVDDAPEGLVMSPTGTHAAVIVIQGSNSDHASWFYHRNGKVVLLKIDNGMVSRVDELEVGALPEGAVFSPCGKYLYVGNFLDADMSVLEIKNDRLLNTGQRIALGGHPAAMRSQSL